MVSEPFHWQPLWLKGALQENQPFGSILGVFLGSEDTELEISFKVSMQMQTKRQRTIKNIYVLIIKVIQSH